MPYGSTPGRESKSRSQDTKSTSLTTIDPMDIEEDAPLRPKKRERNGIPKTSSASSQRQHQRMGESLLASSQKEQERKVESPSTSSQNGEREGPPPLEKRDPRYEELIEKLVLLKSKLPGPEDKIPLTLDELRTQRMGMVGMEGVTPLMLGAPTHYHFIYTRRFEKPFRHVAWETMNKSLESEEGMEAVVAPFLLGEFLRFHFLFGCFLRTNERQLKESTSLLFIRVL